MKSPFKSPLQLFTSQITAASVQPYAQRRRSTLSILYFIGHPYSFFIMSHVLDDPDMQKKIEEFRHVSRMRKDFNMIQSQADTYLLPGFVIQPRKQTSILREQQRLLGCAGVVEAGANNPTDAPPRSLIDCPIQTPLSYSDICKFPKQIRVGDQMVEFYDYVTSSEFDRLLVRLSLLTC